MSLKKEPKDDRSAIAIGYAWSIRVTTLAMEVTILALAGHWLDGYFGSTPIGLIASSTLGLTIFFVHLMAIVKEGETEDN